MFKVMLSKYFKIIFHFILFLKQVYGPLHFTHLLLVNLTGSKMLPDCKF